MYDNGWSTTPSPARLATIVLVLVLLVLLLFQTRTSPAHISAWNGGTSKPAVGAQQGLTGAAAPQAPQRGRGVGDPDVPLGNPLGVPNTVMTQGYGVGTHAPAHLWGAIDLAIDGDGDGKADVGPTNGAPIYATHRGTIKMTPNSVPGGNHVWVLGERYKTGYAHLKGFAPGLENGQTVERGDLIGYVGSTGLSSGPHLDYQVWKDGVNVLPLDYGALDGTK